MSETPSQSHLDLFTREYWDDRYGSHQHLWSGMPNQQLVAYAGELEPRRALDVGCGEGADAIWLAQRGWTVTGVDVSPIALAKAEEHARERATQVEWHELDLFADNAEPIGEFDLVSSHYLHLPPTVRTPALSRLAASVAPGGHLLVTTHHPLDLQTPGLRPDMPEMFHTAQELAQGLDVERWEILATDAPERTNERADGETITVHDAVLFARRRS